MKKQLLTLSFMIMGLGMFSQSTVWKTHDAAIDSFNVMGCRYLWAVDTSTVWTIFYDGTYTTRTMNKATVTHNGNTFKTFKFLPDTFYYNPSNIVGVDDSTAMIAAYSKDGGRCGVIMRTNDSGKTWMNIADTSFMFKGAANFPDVVHFYDKNNGWALGDPNGHTATGTAPNEYEIYLTTDGGVTWTRVLDANIPNPSSGEAGLTNVYTVYGTQNIWYGTTAGRVYHSVNGGNNWTVSSPGGMAAGIQGLAFRDAMNGFVWGANTSGGPVVLKKTTNGGLTWSTMNITGSTSIGTYDICVIPGRAAYMSVGLTPAGTGYVTSVTTDDGATWNVLESGTTNTERMLKVMMLDSAHGWAGTFADQTSPWTLGMNNYIGPNTPLTCPMSISGPTSICSGASFTLTASGGSTYQWSANAGSATTNSVSVTPAATDTYVVNGTSGTCTNSVSYTVTVNATPTVSAVASPTTICALNSTQFTASGAATYNWAPATGLSTTSGSVVTGYYTSAGTYTYNVTGTSSGCSGVTTVSVTVLPCTGIAENANTLANIYPNPSHGVITIDFGKASAGTKVIISDMIGNAVYAGNVSSGTNKVNIDLGNMPKGMYLVTVTNALGEKSVQKMIVE